MKVYNIPQNPILTTKALYYSDLACVRAVGFAWIRSFRCPSCGVGLWDGKSGVCSGVYIVAL